MAAEGLPKKPFLLKSVNTGQKKEENQDQFFIELWKLIKGLQ